MASNSADVHARRAAKTRILAASVIGAPNITPP